MADDENADKSFDASPQRLAEARRKGNVPQSPELLTFARYAGLLLAAIALAGTLAHAMGVTLSGFLIRPAEAAGYLMTGGEMSALFGTSALAFFVPIGLAAVLAIVALIAQQAITFAPTKLKPDLKKINPMENAKNKFGSNGLMEFAKSSVKITAVMIVALLLALNRLPELVSATGAPPALMPGEIGRLFVSMLFAAVILAGVAAAIDVPFKWQRHRAQLRMSRQEVQDEAKESEGDPTQRQARRRKAQEIAQSRSIADVPTADVVVVNPEHYAVALKWARNGKEVPRCVAKGVDHLALRIKAKAEEAGVPVYRDVPTARALYAQVEIGEEIQRDHFEAVAAAIRFADGLRAKKR